MKIFSQEFTKKIYHFSFITAFACATFFSTTNSYAASDYGAGRNRECSNNGEVADITRDNNGVTTSTKTGLDFNPTSGGKDIEFVLTNPVCITVIATSYALVKGGIAAMNSTCGNSGAIRLTPSPLMDAADIARGVIKAATTQNASCGAAVAGASLTFLGAIAQLGVIYGIASNVYNHTTICGANWMAPNPSTYNMSTPNYKQTVQNTMNGYLRNNQNDQLNFSNKTYREWYYGGVEVEDNPANGETCFDVTQAQSGGAYPKQKYYLKGTETGNYNCKKYLVKQGQNDPRDNVPITAARKAEFDNAYNCCTQRSKEYICIDFRANSATGTQLFCQAGSRCTIEGITFSTKSLDNGRIICAESYSLCPYNFTIGGGSEQCDYYRDGVWNSSQGRWIMITGDQVDAGTCASNSEIRNSDCTYNKKAGKCRNYCQYMTHCTKTSDASFHYISSLGSPYFSEACMNFVGDSQNRTAYGAGFILGSQRHFSAPIAQCVKETMENVFYNRAGHSTCLNYDESPSAGGICPSGLYATDGNFTYKKGNFVKERSFFTVIQDSLQGAVKMALTLSIMFYGMNLLLWKASLGNKKEILTYILKIGLVLYFATGDAWQTMFFDGVYGASSEFSQMVFKLQSQQEPRARDGCQFGKITLPDGSQMTASTYPPGKEYLAIWDTLDCKIMRYLGFGPEVSAANIVSLILASFLTGPIGIYFSLSVMFFGIMLIAATMRALHIFLSSAVSIIIFVFISPIIIPLVLFAKTKSIFDNWLKELISFCLQPMILFAYIAIFIMIMDKTLIGSATFSGNPPSKTLNCSSVCYNKADHTVVPYVGDQAPLCDQSTQELVNPYNDSVACLLSFNDFSSWPGLQIIGVSIPIMKNLFSENVKERVLTLLKGALMMYIIYKFMDEIPGITSSLIGGTPLPGSGADALSMFKKVMGAARGLQKRAGGATKKLGSKAGGKGRDLVKTVGQKGKETETARGRGGEDTTSKGDAKTDQTAGAAPKGTDQTSGKGSGGAPDTTRGGTP